MFPQKYTKLATNRRQNDKMFLQLILKWLHFFHFPKLHNLHSFCLCCRHREQLVPGVITDCLPRWWTSPGRSSYRICLGSAHHFIGTRFIKYWVEVESSNSWTFSHTSKQALKNTNNWHLFGNNVVVGLFFNVRTSAVLLLLMPPLHLPARPNILYASLNATWAILQRTEGCNAAVNGSKVV